MPGKLLVIDDDPAGRRLVTAIFAEEGLEVISAGDGRSGLSLALEQEPDVVLLDLHLPDLSGLEVLDELRGTRKDLPVVMLTADVEVKSAVRATQLGALDYLTKPIDPEELTVVVHRALETRALKRELDELRKRVGEATGLAQSMGPSPQVARIIEQVRTVAASGFSVLVLGETGAGKELVAQAIHRESARRDKPFIALDCGAIPEQLLESELFGHEKGAFTGADRRKAGRFHLAQGGTLFLDEIGNLPIGLQAKLLRALESRTVQSVGALQATEADVRFVAATNSDIQERATDGRFRADLYFRLAQYTIRLPALRERKQDIPHLAQRFLQEAAVELRRPIYELGQDARSALERHDWPGNVRELRNVIRRAALESDGPVLRRSHVQPFLAAAPPAGTGARARLGRSLKEVADEAARDAERQVICETLRATKGNKSQAARALKTDYKTLHLKLKSLGIRARDFSP